MVENWELHKAVAEATVAWTSIDGVIGVGLGVDKEQYYVQILLDSFCDPVNFPQELTINFDNKNIQLPVYIEFTRRPYYSEQYPPSLIWISLICCLFVGLIIFALIIK